MRKIETNDWWPQLVALKDELSLRELAERFGVTPGAVTAALKRNGIQREAAPPGPRSRRKQSLPPEPGERGAPRKSKGVASEEDSRSKAHLIEPFADLLGNAPDGEIAEKAGVSMRTVANYRTRQGIAGYSGPKKRGKDRKPRRSRIDPFEHLLGNVPDRIVAEKAGVSLNAVRNYRVKKGISARGRGRPKAGTVPAPGQAQATPVVVVPPGSAVAWKVRLASGEVVVVAADTLAAAASQAEGAGDVVSLEKVGRML
jgi:hypothetical protein